MLGYSVYKMPHLDYKDGKLFVKNSGNVLRPDEKGVYNVKHMGKIKQIIKSKDGKSVINLSDREKVVIKSVEKKQAKRKSYYKPVVKEKCEYITVMVKGLCEQCGLIKESYVGWLRGHKYKISDLNIQQHEEMIKKYDKHMHNKKRHSKNAKIADVKYYSVSTLCRFYGVIYDSYKSYFRKRFGQGLKSADTKTHEKYIVEYMNSN